MNIETELLEKYMDEFDEVINEIEDEEETLYFAMKNFVYLYEKRKSLIEKMQNVERRIIEKYKDYKKDEK